MTPGTRLGPYEILTPLGAGGMGEVFRARDTRLDRDVAIKVLPATALADPVARQRFEREARAVAALDHPHICAIHDIGEDGGRPYLVLEYLEGQTLAQRLARGHSRTSSRASGSSAGNRAGEVPTSAAIPVDEVLRIATELAEAMAAAHRAGVVHRDLKPGNIILTKAGVKVLDFGLAKLQSAADQDATRDAATMSGEQPLTARGTLMGTVPYMAPEQVEGREADTRTDLFAFGAIVFEMAGGRRAFEGNTQASLIAAILEREPPRLREIQALTPPGLERVVARCLAKDPDERWQSAADLVHELRWIRDNSSSAAGSASRAASEPGEAPPRPTRVTPIAIGTLVAALAGIAVGAGGLTLLRPTLSVPASVAGPMWLSFPTPPVSRMSGPDIVVAPGGRRIALRWGREVYIRDLEALDPHEIASAAGSMGQSILLSPDGRWLGFHQGGRLRKTLISGGPSQAIADMRTPWGLTWGPDGTIVFGGVYAGLSKVSADGGAVTPLTRFDPGRAERAHINPAFLPDGEHVIYAVYTDRTRDDAFEINVISTATGAVKRLRTGGLRARVIHPGYLVFAQGGRVFAARFNLRSLEVESEPVPVIDDVRMTPRVGPQAAFDVEPGGTAADLRGYDFDRERSLVWMDRDGRRTAASAGKRRLRSVRLSPDGRRVAALVVSGVDVDAWVGDFATDTWTRVTTHSDVIGPPVWSPDGKTLALLAAPGPNGRVELVDATGQAAARVLSVASDTYGVVFPQDWMPDGTTLLLNALRRDSGGGDLLALPLTAAAVLRPLTESPTIYESTPAVSPDGDRIAYIDGRSGVGNLYVRRSDDSGSATAVSQDLEMTQDMNRPIGPRWVRGGRELVFDSGGWIYAVAVQGQGFSAPTRLIELPPNAVWDVTPDGQRFLVAYSDPAPTDGQLVVITNFGEEIRRRLAATSRD